MAPDQPSRRTVLQSLGALGLAGLGGAGLSTAGARDAPPSTGAWPQFQRDATNTGHDPDGTGATEPPLVSEWEANLDINTSSAVVVDDRVYVSTVYGWQALDADTGERLVSGDTSGVPYATPAVVDDTVFLTTSRRVRTFDAATGEGVWEVSLSSYSAPTVSNGTVYVSADTTGESRQQGNAIVALDAATGEEQWRVSVDVDEDTPEGDDQGFGVTPVVADGTVYAPSHEGVYAIDAERGEVEWKGGPALPERTSPTVADGHVVVHGATWHYPYGSTERDEDDLPDDARTVLLALDADTGDVAWELETGPLLDRAVMDEGHDEFSPAVADGTVYVTTGTPQAIDLDSYVTEQTRLLAVDLDTGEVTWRTETPEATQFTSAPVVVDGTVYLGADGPTGGRESDQEAHDLLGYDAATGDLAFWYWDDEFTFDRADRIHTPPTVVDGSIFVALHDVGGLFAVTEGSDVTPPAEPTIEVDDTTTYACEATQFDVRFEDRAEDYGADYLYRWDFDDDGAYDDLRRGHYGPGTSNQFDAGEHTVRLEVRDRYGQTVTATRTVEIESCDGRPTPSIEVVTETPESGEEVVFEAQVEGDDATAYRWDFDARDDSGFEATGQRVTTTYEGAGDYEVVLQVEDAEGAVGETRTTVQVDC